MIPAVPGGWVRGWVDLRKVAGRVGDGGSYAAGGSSSTVLLFRRLSRELSPDRTLLEHTPSGGRGRSGVCVLIGVPVRDRRPWRVGVRARRSASVPVGRVSALAHQVAAVAGRRVGLDEIRAVLAAAPDPGSAGTAVAFGVETGQTPRPADPPPEAEHRANVITRDRQQTAAITGRRGTVRYARRRLRYRCKNLRRTCWFAWSASSPWS